MSKPIFGCVGGKGNRAVGTFLRVAGRETVATMDDETRRNHVAELRRLEHALENAEGRLKQLIDARLPTSDELDEALTLSNVLPY